MPDHIIPYGKQTITEKDEQAVLAALRSQWLTTGPQVKIFESAFAKYSQVEEAVAVSNGTAALHTALFALDIQAGDEVIVPAITFVATANAVLYQGAKPVFADVDPDTLLIDPEDVARKITPRTRVIIAVDYAGQLCDYERLKKLCEQHNLFLVADSCHAPGATYKGELVGKFVDAATYSFHPVKHLTTAEGGMVITRSTDLAQRMRVFRNHGITSDHAQRQKEGVFYYEMLSLGFNYRLSDLQCALGLSQLEQTPEWILERQALARSYDEMFSKTPIVPLTLHEERSHVYHLYVVRVAYRDQVLSRLRAEGIICNVHYLPVYLHPYYEQLFGSQRGCCPQAEAAYTQILTLPMYPGLTSDEQQRVVHTLKIVTEELMNAS